MIRDEFALTAVLRDAAHAGMPTPMRVAMRRSARQQSKLWPFHSKAAHARLMLNVWLAGKEGDHAALHLARHRPGPRRPGGRPKGVTS